jgi:hypothetical protein
LQKFDVSEVLVASIISDDGSLDDIGSKHL